MTCGNVMPHVIKAFVAPVITVFEIAHAGGQFQTSGLVAFVKPTLTEHLALCQGKFFGVGGQS